MAYMYENDSKMHYPVMVEIRKFGRMFYRLSEQTRKEREVLTLTKGQVIWCLGRWASQAPSEPLNSAFVR